MSNNSNISASLAMKKLRKAKFSRWSYHDEARNIDPCLGMHRLSEDIFIPEIEPKFSFSKDVKIFTIGSCFAREIEFTLEKKDFDVTSLIFSRHGRGEVEGELSAIQPQGNTHLSELLQRYSLPSMLQEIKNLASDGNFIKEKLIYEVASGKYAECHYTNATGYHSFEGIVSQRKLLTKKLREALVQSDVYILTLGLNEFWFDTETELVLNTIPSALFLKKYKNRLEYRMGKVGDLINNADELIAELVRINNRAKIIVTVSPVPLEYTFSGKDIVLQNAKAKNTLHSIAQMLRDEYEYVDYFPSYEMATYSNPEKVWKPDGRHIKPEFVDKITSKAIDLFFNS